MVKPVIVISACIEHEKCRYDGSYIASKFIKKLKDYPSKKIRIGIL